MQINKKPSALADTMFDVSKSVSNISTSAQLHGRYMMLKEMQIFLGEEEIKLNEQIKKSESNV
jgi:hypothetical protein